MKSPLTRRGSATFIAGAVLFVVGVTIGSQAFTGAGVLLTFTVLLAIIWVRVFRVTLEVQRHLTTDLIEIGARGVLTMQVTARTLTPLNLVWRDAGGDGVSRNSRGIIRLRPRVPTRITNQFIAVTRGRHVIGPCSFIIEDPFGFSRRGMVTDEVSEVTVTPKIDPWSASSLTLGSAGTHEGIAHERSRNTSVDVIPRPYSSGDSVRRVHWRATARSGELMVRQETLETSPEMLIVLDCSFESWAAFMQARTGVSPAFEGAVSQCASIAIGASQHGFHVTVHDETGALVGALDGSTDAEHAFLREISGVEVRARHVDRGRPFAPTQTQVMVVTGNVTREAAEHLNHNFPRGPRTLIAAGRDAHAEGVLQAGGWILAQPATARSAGGRS